MADGAPANAEATELGAPPADLTFKVGAKDGKVVVRFDALIQWFDLDPDTAIAFAEAVITNAQRVANDKLARPNRAIRRASEAEKRKLS